MKNEKLFPVENPPKREDGEEKYNNIEIKLSYNLGGINYFTGNKDPRGYYLYITPITITQKDGYTTQSFTISADPDTKGIKYFLKETKRKNDKLQEKLWNKVEPETESLKNLFLKKELKEINKKTDEIVKDL